MIANSADMLGLLTTARPPCETIARRGNAAISFGEFLLRVGAWQHLLRPLDGRAFALFDEDSVEFAATLFGGWLAGKIIYLPGDNLAGTCAALSTEVDGFLGAFDARWSPLAPPLEAHHNQSLERRRLADDFAGLVLYTSGTTGTAQAIGKNLGQLAREVTTLEEQFGGSLERAEIVSIVSHQHIYGLLFRVLWPLAAGRVFHARSFAYFEDLAPMLAARDCALVASPAHLKRLPPPSNWNARSRVKTVFSSGGPLAFEAAQEASALLGTLPIEVYGSSETGGIAWRRQSRADEAWEAFGRVDWRVEPEDGVLEVRSPNLPDERWFRTADRVEIAPGGKFFLRGRIDRIAKVEGKRVSLSAVERQLTTSSLVAEARVALIEGKRQRLAAFVVLSADGRRELAEAGKHSLNRLLLQTLSAHVEPVAIPRLWRYLDCLPINAQGKTTIADLTALTAPMAREKTRPRERLIEQSAERALFELVAPADLIYFDGHFRDAPLLPGVVQIDWVIEYGRRCFDLPAAFRGVHALKFHRLIKPEMVLTLELIFEPAKSALSFKIASAAGTHASGRVLFGPEDV